MIERTQYPVVQQAGALYLCIIDVGPDFCLLLLKRPDGQAQRFNVGLGLRYCLGSRLLNIFLRQAFVVVLFQQNIDSATKKRALSFE